MSDKLGKLTADVQSWVADSIAHKMLPVRWKDEFENVRTQSPATLFDGGDRPLVVGLFGGTGVGKSTLLNRLAGEQIARTSVERPTSREVTLYHHTEVALERLPADFPVTRIHTALHQNALNRHILWIDMPDFDSVESANRSLVDSWLPHIDLLIYVVSPDRYKDDNGWQLLLEYGQRHAWIFVINHWDRGHPEQRVDFARLLERAGLSDPYLYCTDSSGDATSADEFDALQSTVQRMADDNIIQQLEQRGLTVRQQEVKALLQSATSALGSDAAATGLRQHWRSSDHESATRLRTAIDWKIPVLAERFRNSEQGWLKSMLSGLPFMGNPSDAMTETPIDPDRGGLSAALLDDAAMQSVNDELDEIVHQASALDVPAEVVQHYLNLTRPRLQERMNEQVELTLTHELENPGTAGQRGIARVLAWCSRLLPLAALGWAAYRIVGAFYAGAQNADAYLGISFLVNAALLVLLAWGLPWFLYLKVRPTAEQAANRGYRIGLNKALELLHSDVDKQLSVISDTRNALHIRADELITALNSQPDTDLANLAGTSAELQRLLPTSTS